MEPARPPRRPTTMKKYVVPFTAAVAVVAVVLGLWWVLAPDPSAERSVDSGFGGTSGGSTSSGGTSSGGAGSEPNPGSVEPAEPGTGRPQPQPEPRGPADDPSMPTPVDPMAVAVESYHAYEGPRSRRIAVNYTIGVPECYGTIGEPEVEETASGVVVTLTRVPPKTQTNVACIEIALLKSVDIELSAPLGDREILDGSRGQIAVPQKPKASGEPPTY